MKSTELKNTCWKYYLILERGVRDVEPYVSFHPDNYNSFSNEFIKLFQAICSEIDVICKKYCEYIKDTTFIPRKYWNIRSYAECILTKHPEIVEQKVYLSEQSDCEIFPWGKWSFNSGDRKNGYNLGETTPNWWKAYNEIKHNRSGLDKDGKYVFQQASLYNVLNALGGFIC